MTGADTSPGAETGDRSPPPRCGRRRRRVLIPAALLAIVGAIGVSMPALAAVLFDPLPPGEESAAPITPPPPAKPLTGTEWRAQAPGRSIRLLPVELRPKQRIPCAVALSDERLRNPVKTIYDINIVALSELFRTLIEKSDCKKENILKYMSEIGGDVNYNGESEYYTHYYVLFDIGFFASPIIWVPEYFIGLRFDKDGNLYSAQWYPNK